MSTQTIERTALTHLIYNEDYAEKDSGSGVGF